MFEHRPLVFSVASALSDSVALPVTSDAGFTPAALFRRGEEGFYNDIQTYSSTYFEDTAGTDTAELEDTIALILDQSQKLELGPELVNYAAFVVGNPSWTIGAESISAVNGVNYGTYQTTLLSGKFYKVTVTVTAYTSGTIRVRLNTVDIGIALSGLGTQTAYGYSNGLNLYLMGDGSFTGTVTISAQELSGNHITQATAGARPKLSARYNTVTGSQALSTFSTLSSPVVTANAATAPDGSMTADRFVVAAGQTGFSVRGVGEDSVAGQRKKTRVAFKPEGEVSGRLYFCRYDRITGFVNLSTLVTTTQTVAGWIGVSTTVTEGDDGWYIFEHVFDPSENSQMRIAVDQSVAGQSFLFVDADNRPFSDTDQPAYQRVTTATDYDSTGFDPYLQFDLVDDALTATIPAITGGTLVLATRDGIWIDDDINASAGTFSIGPTTYTGGPDGLLSVIGNKLIGPPLLLDRQLTASEKNAVVQWFQSRGAGALYVLGEELVVNGTFDTDTTGWTTVDATISVVSGELEVNSSGSVGRGVQATAVSIGSVYQVKGSFRNGTANADFRVGNTSGGSQYARKVNTGTLDQLFAATTTLTYLSCLNTLGTAYYDNISIRQLTQPGA
ncbi:MAG: hypothetical protein RLZZ602_1611 [Pseudomonadota bacterium]|jgi:hypothetical protein